jgi:hypothetical protein
MAGSSPMGVRVCRGGETFSPSPCGRGLGEGGIVTSAGGWPTPPPNPLPQGEGENSA